MEEALEKLKNIKQRRYSGEDDEEMQFHGTDRNEYDDSDDENRKINKEKSRAYNKEEGGYLVQERGEESKQSDRRSLTIHDFDFLSTLGTGTFGRVRLVKFKHDPKCDPMALKMLK